MAERVLLILSHSIEEHDQLKLLSSLGYEVFSLGGYINPHAPHDPKRPALPEVPYYPELQEAVDRLASGDNIGNAASWIPDQILAWLGNDGVIICHHYLERIYGQWDHLKDWGGRVVWRTVGQSTTENEQRAAPFHADGLEIVRYSPKEMNIPQYAGADALIRFYKDPAEWYGWTGDETFVTNITQDIVRRAQWCNLDFYRAATHGVATRPAGPGSEKLPGGLGELELAEMKDLLRRARAYIYTGTQPASYTLGLIEAMMTGTPVYSIGPSHMKIFSYGHELFEGHELAGMWDDDPEVLRDGLAVTLQDMDLAREISQHQRHRALHYFGVDKVGADWKEFLG